MWVKDEPTKAGWYFWRKTKATKDPAKMRVYYVGGSGDSFLPKNGWWAKTACKVPKLVTKS